MSSAPRFHSRRQGVSPWVATLAAALLLALPALSLAATDLVLESTGGEPIDTAAAGEHLLVEGTGFDAGATVTCSFARQGAETELVSADVGSSGTFNAKIFLPTALLPGAGEIRCATTASTGQVDLKVAPEARRIVDLHEAGGFYFSSEATDVNRWGQVAVTGQLAAAPRAPARRAGALYSGQAITLLPDQGGSPNLLLGISSSPVPQLAGAFPPPGGSNQAGVITLDPAPTLHPIQPLAAGTQNTAYDVNDDGKVVGSSLLGSSPTPYHAFRNAGSTTDLLTLGGTSSFATAINGKSRIVGASQNAGDAAFRAFLFRRGKMKSLKTLPGGKNSYARDVNDSDQVVGESETSGGTHAFLWSKGAMQDLGTLGGADSFAYGINDRTEVVGSSPPSGSASHAFLWAGGAMFDLNDSLPTDTDWALMRANKINELGQAAGIGSRNGELHAFLLSPATSVKTVTVSDAGFSPASVKLSQGGTAQWNNNGPSAHQIADATGLGAYDSGPLPRFGGFAHTYDAAGTYVYVDPLKAGSTGNVKVPLAFNSEKGSEADRFTIFVAAGDAPPGAVYDVQIRRPGAASFASWRVGQTKASLVFTPDAGVGKYKFRARVRRTADGERSGWSPKATVAIGCGDSEPAALTGFTARHNLTRTNADPTPSPALAGLCWNAPVASTAQAWANGCHYMHNPNLAALGRGQNIAAYPTGTHVPLDAVDSWTGESAFYHYTTNSCDSGQACGHYTQIVWRDTKQVGCGIANCTANSPFGASFPNWTFVVCDYDPRGNIVGQRPY